MKPSAATAHLLAGRGCARRGHQALDSGAASDRWSEPGTGPRGPVHRAGDPV